MLDSVVGGSCRGGFPVWSVVVGLRLTRTLFPGWLLGLFGCFLIGGVVGRLDLCGWWLFANGRVVGSRRVARCWRGADSWCGWIAGAGVLLFPVGGWLIIPVGAG